ncbi:MAG: hypothetical protein ACI9LD_001551 [Polaromonas sp.]|jgi:hypothetical protein
MAIALHTPSFFRLSRPRLIGGALILVALLSGCASPITARVSSFQQWPADAAGASFGFLAPADHTRQLEQASYASLVATELAKQGLQAAASGQPARILVDMSVSSQLEHRSYSRPVYQDQYIYRPGFRDAAGRIYPGYWMPDPFGPRYIGNQQSMETVQVSSLRLRLLDTQGPAGSSPRTVFESNATQEGRPSPLSPVVPYLVRAVFEDFPGANGRVQVVRFKADTGEVIRQ